MVISQTSIVWPSAGNASLEGRRRWRSRELPSALPGRAAAGHGREWARRAGPGARGWRQRARRLEAMGVAFSTIPLRRTGLNPVWDVATVVALARRLRR